MAQLQPHIAGDLKHGDILMVIHDFAARTTDELTLQRADRIELVELDDGFGDGWYLGKHLSTGVTGLFPGVYTAKLPAHLSNIPRLVSTIKPENDASQAVSDSPHLMQHSASLSQDRGQTQAVVLPYDHSPLVNSSESASAHGIPAGYRASAAYEHQTIPTAPSAQYISGLQRSTGQILHENVTAQESPVMNETLSVIDEHITDLSTPRQSINPPDAIQEDSESDYNSTHLGRIPSAGVVSMEEEKPKLTPEHVRQWNQRQVADHLRTLGLEPAHCDIFEQQEITGDVLLDMDQAFIYMKEYDFGVMGRRLKTWHKIRDFQNEVKGKDKRKRSSLHRHPSEDMGRNRAASGGMVLPRIPSLMESQGLAMRQSQHAHPIGGPSDVPPPLQTQYTSHGFNRSSIGAATPPSTWRGSMISDSPNRPSAALVRELTHSRRQSTTDFGATTGQESPVATSSPAGNPPHRKQPSLDQNWSLSNATVATTQTSTPPLRLNTFKSYNDQDRQSQKQGSVASPDLDIDRGYFSGNELDNRKEHAGIRRKDVAGSADHSRHASTLDDNRLGTTTKKFHSRMSSVDTTRDVGPVTSSAAKAYYSSRTRSGRFRSASARASQPDGRPTGLSPTVTNLEDENTTANGTPRSASGTDSPAGLGIGKMPISNKALKMMGLRAASDNTALGGKGIDASPILPGEKIKESPRESVDNSRAASVGSRSLEVDGTDGSSKGGDSLRPMVSTKQPSRTKPKTKQETSAYTMGLIKISPEEARKTCDHHGWMKKKASGLMTTWKPRLFILRGRRLSYYYSESDTEERGVIDISGHKVLVANSDPIVTIHATITGAATATSPASPQSADTSPVATRTPSSGSAGLFYFKLVPPKVGASRAVQFTKPTVHYFQCDTLSEGRKWMGEILKATIEHDLSTFETTNRQKTISLAKARERKERPPMLRGVEDSRPTTPGDVSATTTENGLNIQGLNFEGSDFDVGFDEKSMGLESATTDQEAANTAVTQKAEG